MIKPMLCRPVNLDVFESRKWDGYDPELKVDGWRALIIKNGNEVQVLSRTGKDRAGHVRHIVSTFLEMPDGIYDGEIVFVNQAKPVRVGGVWLASMSFNRTARIMGSSESVAMSKAMKYHPYGSLWFYAFDILEYEGNDLRLLDYRRRQEWLRYAISLKHREYVKAVPNWAETGLDPKILLPELVNAGYEGLVLKRTTGVYAEGKRTPDQYKIKVAKEYDVVVYDYTWAKEGKFEGMIGALKFGAYDSNNELHEVGQTSGMDDATRYMWTERLTEAELFGPYSYPITIKSNGLTDKGTDYGVPRHPQYVGERRDKSSLDCSMEQFKI